MWNEEVKVGHPKPFFISKSSSQRWHPFRRGEIKQPEFVKVADDEILLGREIYDEEFETAVTWPYPRKRRMTIVIVGGQGSGKTIVEKSIALDQLHYRMGHPLLCIDPKLDTHSATKPNANPNFVKILKEKYKIKPKGFNIMHVVPEFMDMFGAWGKRDGNEIRISMKDFEPMDKDTRVATMCQILEVKTDEPAYAIISEIMMADELPKTPEDALSKMEQIMETQKIKSDRLRWKFTNLIKTKKNRRTTF